MTYLKSICTPIDPFVKQPQIYSRAFIDDGYVMQLGYVFIQKDVPAILDWLAPRKPNNVWKNESPKVELSQTFKDTLESKYGQSFIVNLVKPGKLPLPICQIDVDQMYGRMRPEYWDPGPGDYLVRLLISPHLPRFKNAFHNAQQLFFGYAFQYAEVVRLITKLDEAYSRTADSMFKAGWITAGRVKLQDQRVIVLCGSRETLRHSDPHIWQKNTGL